MSARLFVDCGGHDGCSVVKFFSTRPGFRAITFEPNPAFRKYYRFLPTQLIEKAVTTYDGTIEFTIDPVDGDGSSIIPEKRVVWDGSLGNEQCPRLRVPCIDLSAFVAANVRSEDYLCLKLDVEGAEYEILDRMLADGTIDLVDELLVEFHWQRCGVSEERHRDLRAALERRTKVVDWDAAKFAIHGRSLKRKLKRAVMTLGIWPRLLLARLAGPA